MPPPINVDVAELGELGRNVVGMAPRLETFGERAADLAALLRRAVGNGGDGDQVTTSLVAKFEKVDDIQGFLNAFAAALRGTGDATTLAARLFAGADATNTTEVRTFTGSIHV